MTPKKPEFPLTEQNTNTPKPQDTPQEPGGSEREVPPARQRVKYDKQKRVYVKQGVWLRQDLLKAYDRIVFVEKMKGRKIDRYMLINEDMEKGLEARKKASADKLKEAGQEELGI